MNKKLYTFSIVLVMIVSTILSGCAKKQDKEDIVENESVSEVSTLTIEDLMLTANNNSEAAKSLASSIKITEFDNLNADCKINFENDKASVDGQGAQFLNGVLSIKAAGTYEISGNLSGRIEVDTSDKDCVNIILNNLNVECSNYAPFTVWNSEKTVIYIKDGTENIFTDSEEYTTISGTTVDDTPTAAIYSKDDIQFMGSGKLIVNALCNDGITGKNDVIFDGAQYEIFSKDDGIVGKDSVVVREGEFTINAGGDGIKSTESTEEEKGFISIEDGEFNIISQNDGIQAESYCYITGGKFCIETKAELSDNIEENESAKGIKAEKDVTIDGGEFKINSTDDALHSNDTLTIEKGNFIISTGDDGLHSDNILVINGGEIKISESYEGIEAENIIITDGEIDITATDDGINAANGESSEGNSFRMNGGKINDAEQPQIPNKSEMAGENRPQMPDESEMTDGDRPQMPDKSEMAGGGRPQMPDESEMTGEDRPQMPDESEMTGEDRPQMPDESEMTGEGRASREKVEGHMMDSESSSAIYIEGGNIYVNADGDGIDSNGTVLIKGGAVYVDGPTGDGDGFFDYDSSFEVMGGTVVGAGSSGMMQSFSDTSQQPGFAVVFESTYSENSTVTVRDSDGNEIISYSPSKKFKAIAISTDKLKVSESYDVYVNNQKCKTIELSSISVIDGSNTRRGGYK